MHCYSCFLLSKGTLQRNKRNAEVDGVKAPQVVGMKSVVVKGDRLGLSMFSETRATMQTAGRLGRNLGGAIIMVSG